MWYQLKGGPRHYFYNLETQKRAIQSILEELEDNRVLFEGAGLFDSIKSHLKGLLLSLTGNRRNLKPSNRDILSQVGDQPIAKLYVARRPLGNTFYQVLSVMRGFSGGFRGDEAVHDQLFHLFIVVELQDGTKIRIEKNEDINLVRYTESQLPEEVMSVSLPSGSQKLTIQGLLDQTLSTIGEENFFDYNAFSTNCQRFVYDILRSNHFPISSELQKFILQDVSDLAPDWGQKIAYFLTSLKNRANLAIQGEGDIN